MRHRFGNPEEHQTDAHAGREQHREPADVAVVGRCFGSTDADAAIGADDQEQAEQNEDVGRAEEEPVESLGRRGEQPREHRPGLVGKSKCMEDERNDREARDHEDGVVDVESEGAEAAFDVVLADRVFGFNDMCLAFGRWQAMGGIVTQRAFPPTSFISNLAAPNGADGPAIPVCG